MLIVMILIIIHENKNKDYNFGEPELIPTAWIVISRYLYRDVSPC
ncbi:conserved hypothetical protein [Xenorhabdus nematophila F1]|uniref:Uncharacterized protein n=1 Tax=Xenorhabdus nematophila (strain ATCC 19061 / DSM 3370 / CCUG 14189 / LMG 1036 / NCIMB 9965 / AN6) TaxID=406817 RepID=D3V9X4_XENNA|nr:hypothetical protein XNC1_1297 [Xenorhabdus nematophila ATCC 19061]CCW31701.1 conserved hypothetical protein [Xenorhabdus nematophila F1]CEF31800.1 hypothetical protein XNW1_410006 [Xenorhabdus nematophila str. Websteri]CEF33123.1 hypothetical protein XNW1_4630006 [Xenorhabdus nematophila str. Websteri]CEK22258.1 hypothetical protein XNC2_1264 [Xenorhabdus nematophila AN6/1]